MKVIDLFAGAGGLSEGFRQENFNIVAHIEKDKSAALTLKTREAYYYLKDNNKVDIYKKYLKKDIDRDELYKSVPQKVLNKVINKEISYDNLEEIFNQINNEEIDVIIGGPPCQAYSLIGRSRDAFGMKSDPRNYLYKLYIEFLKKYKPKMFIFENVMGILSAKKGKIFDDIKKQMNTIGYEIDYRVLNSHDFGILQSRKRVILIGWIKGQNYLYPEFVKKNNYEKINTLFEDLPKIKSGIKMEVGEYDSNTNSLLKKLKIRDSEWDVLTQHTSRSHNDRDLEIYKYAVDVWDNEGRRIKYNELPEKLITMKNTKSFLDRFKVVNGNGLSHTIVAHISKDGHHYIHPDVNQNRSLTVREAARIQSFPDDYYFETCRTDAFKQVGNAVPPLMAREIAKEIRSKIYGK